MEIPNLWFGLFFIVFLHNIWKCVNNVYTLLYYVFYVFFLLYFLPNSANLPNTNFLPNCPDHQDSLYQIIKSIDTVLLIDYSYSLYSVVKKYLPPYDFSFSDNFQTYMFQIKQILMLDRGNLHKYQMLFSNDDFIS